LKQTVPFGAGVIANVPLCILTWMIFQDLLWVAHTDGNGQNKLRRI
jgi:hypothetical protein